MLAYFSHNDPNDDDSEEEDEESDESVEAEERNEDSVSDGPKEATKVLFKIPREKVEHAGAARALCWRQEGLRAKAILVPYCVLGVSSFCVLGDFWASQFTN